jgi:hypothetical protein
LSLDWEFLAEFIQSEAKDSFRVPAPYSTLFHAAVAVHLYVIFAEFNNRRDRREKKRTI